MTSAKPSDRAPGPGRDENRLEVMNFLNEIAGRHPQALSFASGRPAEAFFDMQADLQRVPAFVQRLAAERGIGFDAAFHLLAQYGATNGLINDLVAQQLAHDHALRCEPGRIVMTAGCQEAIDLCVRALCTDPGDVVLVRSPTYIGITGVADLHGIGLAPFSFAPGDDAAAALADAVAQARHRGQRPRALYLVPDFDNPTGSVLSHAQRQALIALCAREGIVVLEDNPYGMFRFEGDAVPCMAALDHKGCVIYLGTFAKTLCPALRVGFAVVPPTLFGDAAAARALVARLSQAKSFCTVNTSQITQAIVGGVLMAEQCSLARRIEPAIAFYRRNRDTMLQALRAEFSAGSGVSWNRPEGGFFLTVDLPFEFGQAEAQACATDFGVLTMPLSFFALDHAEDRRVRLAFSNTDPERIREGLSRFSRFVHGRLEGPGERRVPAARTQSPLPMENPVP